ncbi:MAG: type II secretion system F family protein [Elusimicrobiota bacterium]|nr:type II secretion system F family protein [Elusimicrobiota bacterium]
MAVYKYSACDNVGRKTRGKIYAGNKYALIRALKKKGLFLLSYSAEKEKKPQKESRGSSKPPVYEEKKEIRPAEEKIRAKAVPHIKAAKKPIAQVLKKGNRIVYVQSAEYVEHADYVEHVTNAGHADHADVADHADHADHAGHADFADFADRAHHVAHAEYADNALQGKGGGLPAPRPGGFFPGYGPMERYDRPATGFQEDEIIRRAPLGRVVKESFFSQTAAAGKKKLKGHIRASELLLFTRQLAISLKAGISILDALNSLEKQMRREPFKTILRTIISRILGGGSISMALAEFPDHFSQIYVSMVHAGETGGFLPESLAKLEKYLEKKLEMKRQMISSLLYPALMLFMAVGLVTFMMVYVVPVFVDVFTALGGAIPLPTKIILFASSIVRKYWLYVAGIFAALIGYVRLLIRNNENFRRRLDKMKLGLPLAGQLYIKVVLSRAMQTLAALYGSSIPVLEALRLSKKVIENRIMERVFDDISDDVKKGRGIASALRRSAYVPPLVADMVTTGEKTGELPLMLNAAAGYFDSEVDNAIKALFTVMEPVMIIFLGLIVGFIAVALLLPIFNLPGMIE